jgi:hypothetical protein
MLDIELPPEVPAPQAVAPQQEGKRTPLEEKPAAPKEKTPAPEKQPVVKLEGPDGKQMELGREPGSEG